MRLLHSKCGNTVETTTERIAVRILDVMLEGEDVLRECLLDLVPVRSGKILCYCQKCKEPVDIRTELSVDCIRCGKAVPTGRTFRFKPDWSIICERCYVDLWKRHNGTSSDEGCEPVPLNLKIK